MARQTTPPNILDDLLAVPPSAGGILETYAAALTAPEQLPIAAIRSNGGTQMRAQLDAATIADYAVAMATAGGWGSFPPVVVFYDGVEHWLADGFHRVKAAQEAARLPDGCTIATVPAEVRAGTQRDAILHAAGANAVHGLRRTNADKRRAVETLLRDPEWAAWSNGEIARRCAVDEKTVRHWRGQVAPTSENPKSDDEPVLRRGADGRVTNTAKIGKRTAAAEVLAAMPTPEPLPDWVHRIADDEPEPDGVQVAPPAPDEDAPETPTIDFLTVGGTDPRIGQLQAVRSALVRATEALRDLAQLTGRHGICNQIGHEIERAVGICDDELDTLIQ